MALGLSMSLAVQQKLQLVVAMPQIQWSLVTAFQEDGGWPPTYTPPTFEEETFTPHLRLTRSRIVGYEALDHDARMRALDVANAPFRFAYARGVNEETGNPHGFYTIPLLRNHSIMDAPDGIDRIRKRITRAEYERATAMLDAAGKMERIARAIPYGAICTQVTEHLRKKYHISREDTVLVSVDRGGRIPQLVLGWALGLPATEHLKVDQGSGRLDTDRIAEFIQRGTLRGKHVCFVDSTVDSGRQLRVLQRTFDVGAPQRAALGHRSWNIIGSNEYARAIDPRHLQLDWGVDPDATFEDNPQLMGIDYAPGSMTMVVECPSEASRAIRACLASVPEGWTYDLGDVDAQLAEQRAQWEARQRERRAAHQTRVARGRAKHERTVEEGRQRRQRRIERQVRKFVASKRWQRIVAQRTPFPDAPLPDPATQRNGHPTLPAIGGFRGARAMHTICVVGDGAEQTLSDGAVRYVAEALAPHCSLFAGTAGGNPGAVLTHAWRDAGAPNPEVRLYQPASSETPAEEGGMPIVTAGPTKDAMRWQMLEDSDAVLVLGGAVGTLREVLIALDIGRPVICIERYGTVADYVTGNDRLRLHPHMMMCASLPDAVAAALTVPPRAA